MRLANKNILINGGTKGVARTLIPVLLNEGANVIFSGRDVEAAKKIFNNISIKDRSNLHFVATDLSKINDCNILVNSAINRFGELHGFVNYSGITPVASLEDCSEEVFDEVFSINIKAPFFLTQWVVKSFKSNGGGSIVLIGSPHSWGGQKDRSVYAVSKGALYTLSEHIAKNYAEDQIRCNFVTMGWTATDGELLLRKEQGVTKEDLQKEASKFIPMKRMTTAEDQIPAIIYLLSDESKMVTGSNFRITGGEYI